jgi:hypothetical protein
MEEQTEPRQTEKRETRDEKRNRVIEEKISRLREIRGMALEEITGYVYRETWEGGRQALPPVEEILLDHEIGLRYGPGKYIVTYHLILDDGSRKMQTERYNIGPEYTQLHLDDCRATGRRSFIDGAAMVAGAPRPGPGIMDFLNEDKAKGLLAIAGVLKMILGGNGAQGDQVETLKAVLDGNNKVLAAALQGRGGSGGMPPELITLLFDRATKPEKRENPAALLRDQMDLFKEIQVLSNPAAAAAQRAQEDEEEERSRHPMQKMIEKALEYLPGLLEKFNGNETAAAQHLKKTNFLVSSYLKKPDVARAFFDAVARDHGADAAARWAAGFGLNAAQFQTQSAAPGVIQL